MILTNFEVMENGCHEWRGAITYPHRSPIGYGYVYYAPLRKNIFVHRLAWELANGHSIPQGMVIMHKCDNSICINPEHLALGTQLDNVRDMVAKGRSRFAGGRSGPIDPETGRMRVKNFCINGHEYTPENTAYKRYKNGTSQRRCRTCKRIQDRKQRLAIFRGTVIIR